MDEERSVRMIPDGASSSSSSTVDLNLSQSVDSVADVGKSRQELTIDDKQR